MPAVSARSMNADAVVSGADGDVHLLTKTIAGIPEESTVDESDSESEATVHLPLGPEPELTMTKMDQHIEYEESDVNMADVPIATIPDRFKFKVSLMLWILCLCTFAAAFLAIKNEGLFCSSSPNDETSARLGTLYTMQNHSASPCEDFYEYACGDYNAEFYDSSIFSQTQRKLIEQTNARNSIYETITNMTKEALASIQSYEPDAADAMLNSVGIFGCFELEVSLDFNHRAGSTGPPPYALYLSVACPDCAPTRSGGGKPQQLHMIPEQIAQYPEAEALMTLAFANQKNVYFLPPNNSVTDSRVILEAECTANTTARSAWITYLEDGAFEIANTLYSDAVDAAVFPTPLSSSLNNTVYGIIANVKKEMVAYLQSAEWAAPQLAAFIARVNQVPVHFGGGQAVIPSCHPSVRVIDCVERRWQAQGELLQRVQGPETPPFCIAESEVNAVYCGVLDAVYIPRALATPPFYDMNWTEIMQMATLGYVVAHELAHSLSPQLILVSGTNITLDRGVASYQMCVANNLDRSGSNRVERTLQEAFADHVAVNTITRAFRKPNTQKALSVGFTLFAQNFCNAGSPKYLPSGIGPADSHPTPFLRVDTTLRSQLQMQTAFNCPASFNHGYTCAS